MLRASMASQGLGLPEDGGSMNPNHLKLISFVLVITSLLCMVLGQAISESFLVMAGAAVVALLSRG
jgi:hypothetical protein